MERRMIAPGFVDDALRSVTGAGLDPAPLLAAAGLPAQVTEPVTTAQYGRLWWLIAEATQDEFFGHGARPMRPGSFALLCHCVLHAGTLQQALERALRFLAVVLDDPRGTLTVRNGTAEIVLAETLGPRDAFAYRTFWVILMGVACWLVGRRFPLLHLEFACADPVHRDAYHRFFGAPARFGATRTALGFDAAFLSLPVVRDEAALSAFLHDAPGNILFRFRHDRGTAASIVQRLGDMPPSDWPDFETLARDLRQSPVTLRRRLRADGQSYNAIRAELRARLAQRLLEAGTMSVGAIAAELGYSEPSAFYRAFHRWNGTSPRASIAGRDQADRL